MYTQRHSMRNTIRRRMFNPQGVEVNIATDSTTTVHLGSLPV